MKRINYKTILIIIIVVIILILVVKFIRFSSNSGNIEKTPESNFKEQYPAINTIGDYLVRLNYFSSIMYDKGKCSKEYISDENICIFTLSDIKKELLNYDVSILESFNGTECDASKVISSINLSTSTNDELDISFTMDNECMGIVKTYQPIDDEVE